MDGDDVSTGLGEVGDALLGLHNHLRKQSKARAVQSRFSYRALPMLVPVPVPLLCAGSAACCPALPCCYCAPWTHQMAVQHLVGDGAQGLDHQGANGDVGHEAAVHDINVHPVAAGRVDGPDLCAILDDQC